jgi:hypothetical protein
MRLGYLATKNIALEHLNCAEHPFENTQCCLGVTPLLRDVASAEAGNVV